MLHMKMIAPRSGAVLLDNGSLKKFVEVSPESRIILALWEWRCGPLPGLPLHYCIM